MTTRIYVHDALRAHFWATGYYDTEKWEIGFGFATEWIDFDDDEYATLYRIVEADNCLSSSE